MIRIVLADDHALARASLRQVLARFPDLTVVGEAGDGPDAIAVINRLVPDVAIVDMRMPGLRGSEVIQWARKTAPDTRCLALSAFGDSDWTHAARQAGAAGCLPETVRTRDLVEVIRAVHRGDETVACWPVLRSLAAPARC